MRSPASQRPRRVTRETSSPLAGNLRPAQTEPHSHKPDLSVRCPPFRVFLRRPEAGHQTGRFWGLKKRCGKTLNFKLTSPCLNLLFNRIEKQLTRTEDLL